MTDTAVRPAPSKLLRKADYQVDVDASLDPALAPDTTPVRDRGPLGAPDVAFADHPQPGIVAALDNRVSGLSGLALVEDGWRHDSSLDIYTLPAATDRVEALGKVADATVAVHRSGLQVAVEPRLAQEVTARPRPAATPAVGRERGHGPACASPLSAAALAASPAYAAIPGRAPVPRRHHHNGGPAGRPSHRVLPRPLIQLLKHAPPRRFSRLRALANVETI